MRLNVQVLNKLQYIVLGMVLVPCTTYATGSVDCSNNTYSIQMIITHELNPGFGGYYLYKHNEQIDQGIAPIKGAVVDARKKKIAFRHVHTKTSRVVKLITFKNGTGHLTINNDTYSVHCSWSTD